MKIGQLNNELLLGKRDAIHVPIVLVRGEEGNSGFSAGEHVWFTDKTFTRVCKVDSDRDDYHAIVDPFMDREVFNADDQFFVFLRPAEPPMKVYHQFEIPITEFPKDSEIEDDCCRGCY
jgi:hypothetical protein